MSFKRLLMFSTLFLLIEMIVFREFIFGDLYFIFKDLGSDSYVNDYPLLYSRMQAAQEGFLPGWSFYNGLGENLYPYSFEPFSWILFKLSSITPEQMMVIIPLVYIYLAGVMMYMFLSEFRLHFYAQIFGGLVFAFSGYYLLSCTWSVTLFSPAAFHFSLLLFSLQRAIAKKQYFWLASVFFLIGICYPFNIYFGLVLSVFYFLFSFYINNRKTGWQKQILFSFINILLGVGMSAWMLLSSLQLMLQSPRASGIVQAFDSKPALLASKAELISTVYRVFSPNLLGDVNHFSIYRNYFEAPLLYSGLLTLLLVSQISVLGKKGRVISILSLSLVVCIYLSPLVRSMAWLQSGDYYRTLNIFFTLILTVVSSFILSKMISEERRAILPLLIISGILIIFLLIGFKNLKIEGSSSFLIPVFFVVLYVAVGVFQKKIFKKNVGCLIILLIFVSETLITSPQILRQRGICDESDIFHKGYRDRAAGEIEKINKKNHSFFRLEKDFYSGVSWLASYNEAKVQKFRSSPAYNSFNNSNYIEFLKTFDQIKPGSEPDTRFVKGIRFSPALMKLCSVRYFFSSNAENQKTLHDFYSEIEDKGDFKIYEDKNSLPFGFCYRQIISLEKMKTYPKAVKEKLALQYLAVDLQTLKDFSSSERACENFNHQNRDDAVSERMKDTLTMVHFNDNRIAGDITVPERRFLFLSMPYDAGWKATDNARPTKIYKAFGGLCFLVLDKGRHRIELCYNSPFKTEGIWVSVFSLAIFILLFIIRLKAPEYHG